MATIVQSVKYFDASNATIRRHGTYTGPASYVAGGDPLTPADFGLGTLVNVLFGGPAASTTPACRPVSFDSANNKVVWFDMAGAEIAGAVDLSTFSVKFEAIGY